MTGNVSLMHDLKIGHQTHSWGQICRVLGISANSDGLKYQATGQNQTAKCEQTKGVIIDNIQTWLSLIGDKIGAMGLISTMF